MTVPGVGAGMTHIVLLQGLTEQVQLWSGERVGRVGVVHLGGQSPRVGGRCQVEVGRVDGVVGTCSPLVKVLCLEAGV